MHVIVTCVYILYTQPLSSRTTQIPTSTDGTTHQTGPLLPLAEQLPSSLDISTDVAIRITSFAHLSQMFPNESEDCLRYVFNVSNGDLTLASDCILSGPSIETLVSLIRSVVITNENEGRKLQIGEDEKEGETLVSFIFSYYKGPRFDPQSGLRMSVGDEPAIDTGGVQRQVFSEVFKTVAFSDKLGLFEGPPDRRRPAFRISNLSAGMMRLLGRMIGHSIILDYQGFPYLSPACYKYMIGNQDEALTLCRPDDASERVQHVLNEVSNSSYFP